MSIEISSMANQVKEIQTNINDIKLEQKEKYRNLKIPKFLKKEI